MLIKRYKINEITVEIKVEDGISTKEEQTLALINLLKILAEGNIESLIKNNASKDQIENCILPVGLRRKNRDFAKFEIVGCNFLHLYHVSI